MPGLSGRSVEAEAWRTWYSDRRWRRLRLAHLRAHPVCVMCQAEGFVTEAVIVHHIVAHRGDRALFFDPGNLASVCKAHHDRDLQREEKSGVRWAPEPLMDGWGAYRPKR